MKIKIQIKSLAGSVLFELEKEDNTIKQTLVEAVNRGADLRGAYLRGAYLQGADLRGAYLQGAYLQGADLRGAYLQGAYLQGAYLQGADLQGAYLQGAYLRGAYLRGADLQGAKQIPEIAIAQTRILPEGDLIGYKKCYNNVIVKLLIPKEAKRSSAFGRKCRAEFAQVLEIFGATEAKSLWAIDNNQPDFFFKVGETVKPTKDFDLNWMEECSTGIHFYITRIEAENN